MIARWVPLFGIVVASCVAAEAAPATTSGSAEVSARTVPTPGPHAAPTADGNGACEACHPAHSREWRGSLHRASFTNDAFQTSYGRSPFPFCRDCHAPGSTDAATTTHDDDGISCLSCHVTADTDATYVPRTDGTAPHPPLRAPSDDPASACAGCHEFPFPGPTQAGAAGLMQRTLHEHAASEFAEVACSGCHMPTTSRGGKLHHDHTFAVSRRPERLRDALTAEARRSGPTQVELSLRPNRVGHAFPTGDLFRRLEVVVEARAEDGTVTERTRRYLARHFEPGRRGPPKPRAMEADDRLTGPVVIDLPLPRANASDSIAWRVTYQRVDHRDALHPQRSTIHGETVLAAGEL